MVTAIRTASQGDYRLSLECGADEIRAANVAVDYRLAVNEHDAIMRLGNGWREFGIEPGTALETEADVEGMRQIVAGRDPRSGERLIRFKTAVAPDAQLAARPLVEAVQAAADERGLAPAELLAASGWSMKRFLRLEKGLVRDGEHHRAGVEDLSRVATAAGLKLSEVYEPGELAHALAHADERVDIGVRAWDVTLDRPRKIDVAQALAGPEMAARMEEIHDQAVAETIRQVEKWVAYSMTGHHGDGRSADRVDTTGIIATATKHRTARPVGDGPGDPHTHTHVMISVMGRSVVDGKWRTIGAGGRDLMRHVATMGEMKRAIERRMLTEEFGFRFRRDEVTGRWDLVGIPDQVRNGFSRRQAQILAEVGQGATGERSRAAARRTAQAKVSSTRDQERASWAQRSRGMGYAPQVLVQAALEGREPGEPTAERGPRGPGPVGPPDIDALAARVWDPEHGVTSKDKVAGRAKIMAAVAEACEHGLASGEELETLTDAVLDHEAAVLLPAGGASHMTHSDRYTSADIVAAETVIEQAAERRRGDMSARVHLKTVIRTRRAWEKAKGFRLSSEQGRVLMRLTFASHGIDTVVGVAGAGKTTLMSAARTVWEAGGLRVEGAANAAVAAAGLRAEAGIDSGTVASLLHRIENGRGLRGVDVLVLDEAATIDDRSLATLVTEANRTKTKIVGIGDPMQARSVGAGGGFARIHQIVGGEALTENRRQRHEVDRKALERWREGARRSALAMWGEHGLVHAPVDAGAAHEQITAAWTRDRGRYTDPHRALERLVVMAATNADVEALNLQLRAAARTEKHVTGPEVSYRLPGGRTLELAAGDQVRVRANDYRSRRDATQADVLNGFRGVVLEVDERHGAHIEWRTGGRTERAWIAPDQISRGALTHGYAITVASAQGLTVDRAHVHGLGADAHTLYPAMSRARDRVDLYLPATIEPETVRERLGHARTEEEALHRTISAYAATLTDAPEGMVLDELAGGRERRQELDRAVDERAEQAAAQAPTPWRPLSADDARDGHGPAYQQARPRIQELNTHAERLEEALPTLRERVQEAEDRAARGRLALLWEGTTKATAEAEKEEAREALSRTLAEQSRARTEAAMMARTALQADIAQARTDRDHQQRQITLERSEKFAIRDGMTRVELHEAPEHELRRLGVRAGLAAVTRGRERHQDRIQAPAAPSRNPGLDLVSGGQERDLEEYSRRMVWEIEQEDAQRREREAAERAERQRELQQQAAEHAQRQAAREAMERNAPGLGL